MLSKVSSFLAPAVDAARMKWNSDFWFMESGSLLQMDEIDIDIEWYYSVWESAVEKLACLDGYP